MISYFESRQGGERAPDEWRSLAWELSEALQDIAHEFGDRTHQSGQADYVVQFLESIPAGGVAGVGNWFVVAADTRGIEILELATNDQGVGMTRMPYGSKWMEEVKARFRRFRARLEPS